MSDPLVENAAHRVYLRALMQTPRCDHPAIVPLDPHHLVCIDCETVWLDEDEHEERCSAA